MGMTLRQAENLLLAAKKEFEEAHTRLTATNDGQISMGIGLLSNVKGSNFDIEDLRVAIDRADAAKKNVAAVAAEVNNVVNLIHRIIG